jgi:putative flavoprotein involved in K+ transport
MPGLYFLGLTWQHTRGSALIGWVKDDAEFIAEQIAAFRDGAHMLADAREPAADDRMEAPAASRQRV